MPQITRPVQEIVSCMTNRTCNKFQIQSPISSRTIQHAITRYSECGVPRDKRAWIQVKKFNYSAVFYRAQVWRPHVKTSVEGEVKQISDSVTPSETTEPGESEIQRLHKQAERPERSQRHTGNCAAQRSTATLLGKANWMARGLQAESEARSPMANDACAEPEQFLLMTFFPS
jgi:hypothetical protein